MARASVWIGIALMFVGAILSVTVFGAVVGLPMIGVGFLIACIGAFAGWAGSSGGGGSSSSTANSASIDDEEDDFKPRENTGSHPDPGVSE